jgi:peptidoglycan/xylan/chitin deacetylase (PgdA/CDA1 family)
MATKVLLTIDTELIWRNGVDRTRWQETFARSYDPARVGIPYQLRKLAEHDLRAVFFIDPMPAAHFGIDPIKRMIEPILAAGQSVELHLHPQWARLSNGTPAASFELIDYSEDEQRDLLEQGCRSLMEAGATRPIAFRAGSYSANDATLRAAASIGLRYDSSHNGSAHPWPSAISLPVTAITPIWHQGITEIPVTMIAEPKGMRHLQICAVSYGEMRGALGHAARKAHPVTTIIGHSFELAARNGLRANRVHRRRFDRLCEYLAAHRAGLPTCTFADLDGISLNEAAEPFATPLPQRLVRQVEQLWSNLVEERG